LRIGNEQWSDYRRKAYGPVAGAVETAFILGCDQIFWSFLCFDGSGVVRTWRHSDC